jgi:undecaprenyl-diphosphatase
MGAPVFAWIAELDARLFTLINVDLHHPVLDVVMRAITTQQNWYPVLGGLAAALLIWGGRRGRMAVAMLVIAVAITDQISCSVLKPLVGRVRPPGALAPENVHLIVGATASWSFPSAHAANSFAMATVVSWRFPRFAPVAFLIAAAVAYSRVYVGVHYPLDAIGGAILGLLTGRLAIWIVVALRRRWDAARARGAVSAT